MVNHWGTVLSKEKFEPREQGGRVFTTAEGIDMDEDDYNYTGETLSVSEYLEKYDELSRKRVIRTPILRGGFPLSLR